MDIKRAAFQAIFAGHKYQRSSGKKYYKIFILAVSVFAGVSASAGEKKITLYECLGRAMQTNAAINTAGQNLDEAYNSRLSAVGRVLPSVSASAGYGYSGDESYSYGLSARQALFDGFSGINGIRIENENIKKAKAEYDLVKAGVIYNVKSRYINLYKAQESLELAESILKRREQQAEVVRARYESGREHKGSYLTSKALAFEAETEIKSAERNAELAGMSLSAVMGPGEPEVLSAVDFFKDVPSAGKEPVYAGIALNTPEFRKLDASGIAAGLRVETAKASFYPSASLSGSYGKSGDVFLPKNESWRLGLNISFSVFSGFDNIVSVSSAKSQYAAAKINREQGYTDKIISLKEKWNAFKGAEEKLAVKKEHLAATEARAEIAQAKYSSGLLTYDNWIIIENELISYKKAYLNALADLYLAEAAWEYEKGACDYEKNK